MKMLKQRFIYVTVIRIVKESMSKTNNNKKAFQHFHSTENGINGIRDAETCLVSNLKVLHSVVS